MKWRGSKCDDLIMEVEGKFVYLKPISDGKMTKKMTLEFELDKMGSLIPTWTNKGKSSFCPK